MSLTLPAPGIHVCISPGHFALLVPGGTVTADVENVTYDVLPVHIRVHNCYCFPGLSSCLAAVPIQGGYTYLVNLGSKQVYEVSETQAEAFVLAWEEYGKAHQAPPTCHVFTMMSFFQNPQLPGWESCEFRDGAGRQFYGNVLPRPAPQPLKAVVNAFNVASAANIMQARLQVAAKAKLDFAQNSHDITWTPRPCECGAQKALGLRQGQAGHSSWCPAH